MSSQETIEATIDPINPPTMEHYTDEELVNIVERIRSDRLIIVNQYQAAQRVKKQARAETLIAQADRLCKRLAALVDKSDELIVKADSYRAKILTLRAQALDDYDEELNL